MSKLDKPSQNEDEYFAQRDLELRQKLHREMLQEREAAERRTHYMKCPKCGADLGTTDYEGVQIDRCPDCQGVWLDAGELEVLHQRDDRNVLARIVSDVRKALGEKKGA
jgi:hypothetical protein